MSTNKTPNYNLHAWEPGDDFLRTEFNDNFAAVDAALAALAAGAPIPKKLRLAAGTYTGDGQDARTISLGFRPRAVLVSPKSGYEGQHMKLYADGGESTTVSIGDEGFTVSALFNVSPEYSSGGTIGSVLNPYSYLALGWEE